VIDPLVLNDNGAADRTAGQEAASAPAVRERLAGTSPDDQLDVLSELVRTEAAGALGHAAAGVVEPEQEFVDTGFDSLSATDFRRRLESATGLGLPETLVFDFPTPARLAEYLRDRLVGAALDSSSTSS
jgi:acyl carrier protein